jgi:hypothetical protein
MESVPISGLGPVPKSLVSYEANSRCRLRFMHLTQLYILNMEKDVGDNSYNLLMQYKVYIFLFIYFNLSMLL